MAEAIQMPQVAIQKAPFLTRFIFRAGQKAVKAAEMAWNIEFPQTCRARSIEILSILWLGPDEFLLLMPNSERDAFLARSEDGLNGLSHSLVEVSARQVGFELRGSMAKTVLSAGCPLDFDNIPVGACTRTVMGKVEIILWRREAERFHLEVWRSFQDYLQLFLTEATR